MQRWSYPTPLPKIVSTNCSREMITLVIVSHARRFARGDHVAQMPSKSCQQDEVPRGISRSLFNGVLISLNVKAMHSIIVVHCSVCSTI